MSNDNVLRLVRETKKLMKIFRQRQLRYVWHIILENGMEKLISKEKIDGRGARRQRETSSGFCWSDEYGPDWSGASSFSYTWVQKPGFQHEFDTTRCLRITWEALDTTPQQIIWSSLAATEFSYSSDYDVFMQNKTYYNRSNAHFLNCGTSYSNLLHQIFWCRLSALISAYLGSPVSWLAILLA